MLNIHIHRKVCPPFTCEIRNQRYLGIAETWLRSRQKLRVATNHFVQRAQNNPFQLSCRMNGPSQPVLHASLFCYPARKFVFGKISPLSALLFLAFPLTTLERERRPSCWCDFFSFFFVLRQYAAFLQSFWTNVWCLCECGKEARLCSV